MSLEISTIDVCDTVDVEIINPETGEPWVVAEVIDDGAGGQKTIKKVLSVTMYGPASRVFADAQTRSNNRIAKRVRAKGKTETTTDEDIAHKARFLADITVRLNNFTYRGKSEGEETFLALYSDLKVGFITNRVNAEAGDWGNFTKAASSS